MQPGAAIRDRQLSTPELSLSIAVLAFTILVILVVAAVPWKKGQGWGPSTTKLFIIVVVVGASLFLLTAGYSAEQITPIVGLLGTIVGYALGRSKEDKEPNQ